MAYDDIIPGNQGSVKISEAFSDTQLDIIKTAIGESGIRVLQQIIGISGDALRRINYILYSPGQMNWDGTKINFDSNAVGNNAIFRLLQTEDSAPYTIDLIMQGQTAGGGGNDATHFQNMPLNNGELIYLELDRTTILSSGGSVILQNAVSGGSLVVGHTVRRVALSALTGMPHLTSQFGAATNTFAIPLAMRIDYVDTFGAHSDILWIPHGIKWPIGTTSTLGAIVVEGLETWPSTFVKTEVQLQSAITNLTTTGGIILISQPFTIDTTITLPAGVSLVGKSDLTGASNPATLTISPGGTIVMGNRCQLKWLNIQSSASFGVAADEQMVLMSNTRSEIWDCQFTLNKADAGPRTAKSVAITGNDNRLFNNKFLNVSAATWRTGIEYTSGTNNIDMDTLFT